MKKVLIHGFYGYGNLGDEIILASLLKGFRRNKAIKPVVFSSRHKNVKKQHRVKSVSSCGGIFKRLNQIYHLKTSDLFILGGGGLLKDYGNGSSSLKEWLKLLRLAQRFKVKSALCCIGVENIRFEESKRLLQLVLNKVDLISVRDNSSKHLLESIGIKKEIEVVGDPGLLLAEPMEVDIKKKLDKLRVMVCVRHWFSEGFFVKDERVYDAFLHSLANVLDYLIEKKNATIEFVPMRTVSYDDDRKVARKVYDFMKNKDNVTIQQRVFNIKKFINKARQSSLILGMRLHSLIIGASVGTPIVGFEYMPKIKGFMEMVGQDGFSFDMSNFVSKDVIKKINQIFKNNSQHRKRLINKTSKVRGRTKNFLNKLINTFI